MQPTAEESQSTAMRRPLHGIRVLDLSTYISGPFCTTLFAEFGAEVIKVELPRVGDPLRRFGTITPCGDSLTWLSECRNKKSATLDLRQPDGAALLRLLVRDADIVVENFQPGTLEKWGLGWDVLKKENPRLVMVRVSGYGQTGPYRDRPGFGRIANAFGGLSFLAGYPDRPPVTPGSATVSDYLAGVFGALGGLLALRSAESTQEGQVVDVGLYEPIFRILDELAGAFHMKGLVRQRMGPGTVNVVPHSHYPTSDQRWIAIACTNDKMFARLAQAMGAPELAEKDRWQTVAQREQDRTEVDRRVSEWTSQHTRDHLLKWCEDHQVPCGPIYSIDEIFDDPQYRARENIKFMKDERAGDVAIPNVVPRLMGTPGRIDSLGPQLGQHNDYVYKTLLGLSDDRLSALRAAAII